MSLKKVIKVRGAHEHNLRHVDIEIPRDQLCVITGVSGSGKSSLAFDTIYVEGQRRFMESLSSYARQFLTQASKPKVEQIEGLGPTIAIEQRKGSMNPRSTVATVTEIYDYLRVLFARAGTPHCPSCGKKIARQTSSQVVDQLMKFKSEDRFILLAPLVEGRKGEHKDLIEMVRRQSFTRLIVDDTQYLIDEVPPLDKRKKHSIYVVVDRLKTDKIERARLAASIETALKLGQGRVLIDANGKRDWYSTNFSCIECSFSFGEIEPRNFSFNSPFGACESCHGLGTEMEVDIDALIPDQDLSLNEGALKEAMKLTHFMWLKFPARMDRALSHANVPMEIPFKKLKKAHKDLILFGDESGSFPGIITELEDKFQNSESESTKARIHHFMGLQPCRSCHGSRLKQEMQAITISNKSLPEFTAMTVKDALSFLEKAKLGKEESKIALEPIKEIRSRLSFLVQVGLHYLNLNRTTGTLSGGEAQRIRLASQIGSGLVGVVYVLDEPSIGLHQRDNAKLIESLRNLNQIGNTVIVVEHDEATIEAADFVVDVGPKAGVHGGRIVAAGLPKDLKKNKESLTGAFLSGKRKIEIPRQRRKPSAKKQIELKGAKANNLKKVDLKIPLGCFVAITGVSGSGKSTLINQTLYPALKKGLKLSAPKPGEFSSLKGVEHLDKVIDIDQSPIGRSSRSNPATYVKIFDAIRNLYSKLPLAKARGYKPGRFSFNVKGGRCEACEGQGTKTIEMHFLADVEVVCEVCRGERYGPETLEIEFKGKTISDVLRMTVEEAHDFFQEFPDIVPGLRTMMDVGLSYLKLGQNSTTLSGGESQRIKLASELSKRSTGKTFYILDEPTTGLHFADIEALLNVLQRLVEMGNTVLVIEHNLDVIKVVDHIIDLGPEGGDGGGQVIAMGTPEKISRSKGSHTGVFLKELLSISN